MTIEQKEIILPNGKTIVIKSALPENALSIIEHRTITSGETDFLGRYPEEVNKDVDFISKFIQDIQKSPDEFMVTAFDGDRVIGDSAVTHLKSNIKYRHRAYFGISIQKEFWGKGLGTAMLESAIDNAAAVGFDQLELGVFSDNVAAIHLYEKCGFKSYGIQPRAFKLKDGRYCDDIIMVRFLDA